MEPIFNENYYKNDGIRNHFPKPSSTSHNILCSNCTENQQKIVQLLQSFDTNSSIDHRKQYELYANKLESRYPLCATCSYRVSMQLKKCEGEAGLEERRHTALSGGDWKNKLKLAEKMKWKQFKRKIIKGIFFWPDFLFQLFLTGKCVVKDTKFIETEVNFNVTNDLKIWLPSKHFDFGSFYFVICSCLFFIQFNGIALNRRSPFELIPQISLLILRLFIGNFLFKSQRSATFNELNMILAMTAIGLAIVFKTKSRNTLIRYQNKKVTFTNRPDEIFYSKSPTSNENQVNQTVNKNVSDKNGFASYNQNYYKYHSFANQVSDKPIMPWSEKPLPGKLTDARVFNYNENLLTNNNNNNNYKMRPSKLVSDDPLELEPMFSSFSLSDEPKTIRRSAVRTSVKFDKPENKINAIKSKLFDVQKVENLSPFVSVPPELISNLSIGIIYNCLLTLIISTFRVVLMQQTSLISIILALTFGLRGFVWPRLSLKTQIATLTVAVARLAWLGAELNGKVEQRFGYFALALDLILIILR